MKENITWAAVSTAVGIIIAWIAIIQFVLEPLDLRLENARQNFLRAVTERDQRMDYLQKQIDDLENAMRRGKNE